MATAEQSAPETGAAAANRKGRICAESARYGVLRRLAPSLKHDMVVNLQAVAMMAEVLNARLERGSPAPSEFQASISKLNRLAREAVMNCLKVAGWIQPVEDEGIRLPQGVDECLALLASNFNFRGFSVAKDVAETDFEVSRVALRHLLTAALITLTDAAAGPCEVRVKAEVAGGVAEISVRAVPKPGAEGLPFEAGYRQLEWADVQALASAEGVELVRSGEQIVMRMPRAVATAPLQIAPL
ncbi:hypothetical protein [Ramlibacter sp.]|uniref:hypothetical protein n=1 Tax=Ramlibacter sp. TaxID=1917967 RepID=UPI002C5B5862|nr:hypothetical protein [Ramlibacter sp.]HWI83802.1 hypothetical protein [Ramlibacter sp.]